MGVAISKDSEVIQVVSNSNASNLKGEIRLLPPVYGQDVNLAYTFRKIIGTGGFAQIYEATHLISDTKVAIKSISKHKVLGHERFVHSEIQILSDCHYSKIVTFLEAYEDASKYYIIMELLSGVTLKQYLNSSIAKGKLLSESQVARYMKQILKMINYIHTRNIVHRDICLDNFILVDRQSSKLKMIDFGLAVQMKPNSTLQDCLGTLEYTAPEVFSHKYGKECDMWAAGVIMHALLLCYLPFEGKCQQETITQICTDDSWMESALYNKLSVSSKSLLRKLLNRDRDARITAVESLSDPWFNIHFS